MTPYYQDDKVTIYNCDFRELDISPHLLIVDPPFDIWGKVINDIISIDTKTTIAFTIWQHRDNLLPLGRPRAEIIWAFGDGRWVSHKLPRITHETILIYGETGDAYVGRSMEGVQPRSKGKGSVGRDKMPHRTWVPRERALLNSYIYEPRNVQNGVWTKPLKVISPLIEWLCPPEALIFDPFMGSGTSLVAAKSLNRKAIGCDISEAMCELAVRRLNESTGVT